MKTYKELEVKGLVKALQLRDFGVEVESGLFGPESAVSMIISKGWELVTVSAYSNGTRTYHFVIDHEKL